MPLAIPALIIALRLFLQVFTVWALRLAYAITLGIFLRLLADQVGRVPFVGGKLRGAVLAVDDKLADALGKLAQANEAAIAGFFDGLGQATDMVTDALVFQAGSIYNTIDALVHGELPRQLGRRTAPVIRRLGEATAASRARDRSQRRSIDDLGKASKVRDKTEAQARARGIDRLNDIARDVTMPAFRSLRESVADVRGYTARTARAAARRISRLDRLLAAGALTAAATAVMVRRFPWHQCTNVKGFNRALCRSPITDWSALLGLFAFTVTALDPERIAHIAEDVTDELGAIIETMAAPLAR